MIIWTQDSSPPPSGSFSGRIFPLSDVLYGVKGYKPYEISLLGKGRIKLPPTTPTPYSERPLTILSLGHSL